jgi:formyl-CoA transferase
MPTPASSDKPPQIPPAALGGLKVLELGQLIAGPFAAKTLADFGAEVIKIEPPGSGDPLRKWRLLKDGTSVWWQVQSRNKRSLALDLRTPEGQGVVRQLALEADVLIENFRPGALEGWGLAPDDLLAANPRLIVLRISGYGQTGPYRNRPGFGVVAEAMGGMRHLTAEPGRVPVRGAAGSALPGIAPTNAYRCADGGYALIAGNGDSIFRRLMTLIGRDDLAHDASLADNAGRVARVEELDAVIGAWTAQRSVDDVLAALDSASVPSGRIYTVADIAADPHYRARDMLQDVPMDDGSTLTLPGIVPKLSATPGSHRRNAPTLGQDTGDVLRDIGLTEAQIVALRERGIVN